MKIIDKTASVYIIRNKELDRVKIGYSNKPIKRFREIMNQSGCDMELCYHTLPVSDFEYLESLMHNTFAPERGIGEWFHVSSTEAVDKLKELSKGIDVCSIVQDHISGMNATELADKYNVSRTAMVKYLKGYGAYKQKEKPLTPVLNEIHRQDQGISKTSLEAMVARNNAKIKKRSGK